MPRTVRTSNCESRDCEASTTGIVLLATLVAAAGTFFGAVAVPEEHPGAEASEHDEHAETEHEDALRPGELTGALLISLAGIGIVPLALGSVRRRDDDERRLPPPEPVDGAQALRLAVAVASAGAATIHFAVIAQHLEEYWLFGSFFVGVAVLQLAWALLVVVRPSPLWGALTRSGVWNLGLDCRVGHPSR